MKPEVVILPDAAAVAAETTRRIVAAIAAEKGTFSLALAGGSTPKIAYAQLAAQHADDVDWSRVAIFFGDERCYPPDHSESNFRMVKTTLLDPLAARGRAPLSVARIEGELDPDEAARRYAAQVPNPFSLILLGMGPDGHTASLFPGASILRAGGLVAATAEPHLGVRRVSFTYETLNAAQSILVSVTGGEKAASLKLALEGPPGAVPLRDVRPSSGRMTILCDAAAADR